MFSTDIFATFLNPTILLACLVVGYVIKHWIKDADNKIIPTTVFIVGIVLAISISIANGAQVTVDVIVMGAISGLASTGLHQVFKTWLDNFGSSNS